MRPMILAALVLVSGPVLAQSAKVISGEHDGFSRLVVELPGPSDWQLGRTADGYALALSNPPDGYDLSGVFDLIRRDRLAIVSVNATTGNLQFGLACACYAIPFEFRPGVIVVDIRDGAPPEGSSFELPLDKAIPSSSQPGAGPPAEKGFDGINTLGTAEPEPPPTVSSAGQIATPDQPARWVFSTPPVADRFPETAPGAEQDLRQWPSLDDALRAGTEVEAVSPRDLSAPPGPMTALRDDLLFQISRGAARGVVDLATAASRARHPDAGPVSGAFAQVAIDPIAGMLANIGEDPGPSLTSKGAKCIADDRLSIAQWGGEGPAAAQFSTLTSGIVGEFDAVDPIALAKAIKLALRLGFGVEAGRMIEVFPAPELAAEGPVWASMGRIVDGYLDPKGAFVDMQTCDSAAALWAVLAIDQIPPGDQTNTEAVLRSFSALPLHLRLALGPTLAQRFLEVGRSDIARSVRGAIERAPAGAGYEAALIGAKLDMASGDHEGAAALAQGVIKDAGPGVAEAMLALVGATLAQGKPVDRGTTDALAAILRENQGAALEGDLAEALILALASGGSADAAFLRLPEQPEIEADLWAVLATSGTDDDLLKHAILEPGAAPAEVAPETGAKLAARLRGLGFAQEASLWHGDAGTPVPPPDASSATLPADPSAAEQYARILARDWNALADSGGAPWQRAARHVATAAQTDPALAPLAEGASLLEEAAAVRTDITALLSAVTVPSAAEPLQDP